MKHIFLIISSFFLYHSVFSQEVNTLFKDAEHLERQMKEPEALSKYNQILLVEPNQVKALIRAIELNISIGKRSVNTTDKISYYNKSAKLANYAFNLDSTNADILYATALAKASLLEIETDNKRLIVLVKEIKHYADKALTIQPNHALGNFIEGRWHYEMVTLNWAKKWAVKAFYKNIPEANMDSAILHFERCKTSSPYFMLNYLYLAKAYKEENLPAKANELLNKIVKLPILNYDDTATKEEAKRLLEEY